MSDNSRRATDVAFLVGYAVYVWIRHVYSERVKGNERAETRIDAGEKALLAVVAVGNLLLPLLYVFSNVLGRADYASPDAVRWGGVAVMAGALWLFYRSHADLGLNWSITIEARKGHELITHGVYRRIRHPMYAAIFLFGVAQALMLPNWIAGPAAVLTFAPLYLRRVPREERLLRDLFGAEYDAYVGRSGRLLPRLRR